ncbi:Inactive similar to metal-dependent protease, putative molecular chaperone [Rubellimicrobium mesophilum DSM 19309]|uniref:Inactive similar to metal-dependent protease, putative molecular chaperone n=1 Tax=Rubellimicrobium mesophilum DSM 19309 TaxID=442562 RepID=A0A017HQK4_9RHOB|nr:tRNA (adenosine(37)-N6)-threonylcarbamoyltransferase complex dimerization subunit type 1 TsaB [Rubellimicrobium mesophilum]EYD76453.1 Inactive similar to metal-dependent protease, putative molecular chaperone [Rubellimicrobium mesophilum DSM 19309]
MRPEPLLLAFDTSAAHCAAALLSGDRVLASRGEDMGTGQAERLMPMLEEVLRDGGATWRDLSALGVGTGPGNFTGVRISVAAARGLALGLKVPAIGVTAFEALAWGFDAVLTARDARLGQVHLQAFGPAAFGPVTQGLDAALPPLPPGTPVVGDVAEELAARFGGTPAAAKAPLAEAVARIARSRLGRDNPRPAPLYLRAPDAAPPRDPAPVILPG